MTKEEFKQKFNEELLPELQSYKSFLLVGIGTYVNVPCATGCYYDDQNELWIVYEVDDWQGKRVRFRSYDEDKTFQFLYESVLDTINVQKQYYEVESIGIL